MKINQSYLQRLEKLVEEAGYILRYERGSFQSGFCILEHKKVVVLNKFLTVEGRVNTIMELLPSLKINIDLLTLEQQHIYEEIMEMAGR
ncbi:MAG: hypothetical protein J0H55_03420 [Chitinophagaceae bacterium]|nr:hypothetical protein [Chitinophagaceae bacterium]